MISTSSKMNMVCCSIILTTIVVMVVLVIAMNTRSHRKRNVETFNSDLVFHVPHIKLRYSDAKGSRGIFADKDFKEREIIEYAPYVEIDKSSTTCLGLLGDYVFAHASSPEKSIVALGYLSLYNHDDNNNVRYLIDDDNKWFVVEALRDIKKGEELYNSYGSKWWEDRPHLTKK